MSADVTQIAVGVVFASGYWTFPRWLAGMRRRAADRGELARFDSRFGRVPRALGGYVFPGLGAVLVVTGIAFLLL